MQTSKKIKLTTVKQLIDLNGDKVNFDLVFEVKTVDNSPFEALVVTQTILDSEEELKYKNVSEGIISGNIVSDKGIYDNYFILLKANKNVECDINIIIKDIEVNKVFQQQQQQQQQMQHHPQQQRENTTKNKSISQNTTEKQNGVNNEKKINWKLIITIFILIIGSFVLWYFYKNSNKRSQIFSVNVLNPNKALNVIGDIPTSFSSNNDIRDISSNINNILNDTPVNTIKNQINLPPNLKEVIPVMNHFEPEINVLPKPEINVLPKPNSKLLSKINNIPIW